MILEKWGKGKKYIFVQMISYSGSQKYIYLNDTTTSHWGIGDHRPDAT